MDKTPILTIVKPYPEPAAPDITNFLQKAKEFHDAYEVPKTRKTEDLYITLVEEEHEEWVEEYYSMNGREFDELKELTDLLYVTAGLYYVKAFPAPTKLVKYYLKQDETWDFAVSSLVEKIATGSTDKTTLLQLMYCINGYAEAMGWDINQALHRVHHSNMSKLGDDGKPIRRADGKVLKGPNYKEAYLEDLTNGN